MNLLPVPLRPQVALIAAALIALAPLDLATGSALPPDGGLRLLPTPAGTGFGASVSSSGSSLAVGMPGQDSAWVYVESLGTWTRQARVTGDDTAVGDGFGAAVAMDANTLVVGAPSDDNPRGTAAGAVYVFTRTSGVWTQQDKLVASDLVASSAFGGAVAIRGDVLVAGASALGTGAAYVFTRSAGAWTQQAKLLPLAGAVGDEFGRAVAIDGDTIVAGAPSEDRGPGSGFGAAHVYRGSGSTWGLEAKLLALDGAPGDRLGIDISISGDTVLAGASGVDDPLVGRDAGAAYVFSRAGGLWAQQAKLRPSAPAGGALFGHAVGLKGNTAVVGAPVETTGAGAGAGSAWVFTSSLGAWTERARLSPSDARAGSAFGLSVAAESNRVAVGAPNHGTLSSTAGGGSGYVFGGSSWSQQEQFLPVVGASLDRFGWSTAIDGATAVVGALNHDTQTVTNAGAAFVFVRDTDGWVQEARLTASDDTGGDAFGSDVDVSGNTAVVGAQFDEVGSANFAGSAYVFARSGSTWTQQARLTASDAAASDSFAHSVAIDGDTIVIGAHTADTGAGANAGAVYVFARSGSTWTQQAKLTASDAAAGDLFGASVALDGTTLVVGANGDDTPAGSNAGSVYVFVRSGNTWTQQARLTANDAAAGDFFGVSVGVSGNTLVAGASSDDTPAGVNAGSAYVYLRSGSNWVFQQKLTANDGTSQDLFGNAVDIDGNRVLVGAIQHDTSPWANNGAAYIFERVGSTWTPTASLTAVTPRSGDHFGTSVSVSGTTFLVGADHDDTLVGSDGGSAYLFEL